MRQSLVGAAALAALGIGGPALAQSPISVGPLVGINFSDIAGDDFADEFGDTSSRFGLAAGGFAEFGVSDRLAIRPEVVYTQKGAKVDEPVAVTAKLDYVQVPVLAKVMLGAAGAGPRFNILLGPAFGFSAGCALDVDAPLVVVAEGPSFATAASMVEVDCDDLGIGSKGVEVAGVLGVGVDLRRFTFDVRFDRGFTGIFDVDEVDSKHQAISMRAGYKFSLR